MTGKPADIKTKIFLDSGDPEETRQALKILGWLDGQTTNPTLVARHPEVKRRLAGGKKFSADEIWDFYRHLVVELAKLLPQGSISVEVYADKQTESSTLLKQASEFSTWIDNAQIKFPVTSSGLAAAHDFVSQGGRVNMTLVFSQVQAAAVYAATRGARAGQVYLSPFVGRLDDWGKRGLDLVANILKMYRAREDNQVEVLTASVRNYQHFLGALRLGTDIITAPLRVLQEWVDHHLEMPERDITSAGVLKAIPYQYISLDLNWQEYDISHKLTDNGLERFIADWNNLIN